MIKDEKSVLWAECIQQLRSSGQSMRTWCLEHKISTSTMGYWMRKLEVKEQEKESEPVFAKLPTEQEIVANTLPSSSSPIRVFLSGNIRIEITDTCKPELLETLLRTLTGNA